MSLAVQSSGTKSFYVIKKIDGRSEKIFLGKYPALSIENARKMASVKLGQIAVGINPQEQKRTIRAEMTFGQLFEQYINRYSRIHKKTWKADKLDIPRFVGHWFKRKLSDIKPSEIRRLIETIYTENGKYQANKILQRIRAIYNKAIEWGWNGANSNGSAYIFRSKIIVDTEEMSYGGIGDERFPDIAIHPFQLDKRLQNRPNRYKRENNKSELFVATFSGCEYRWK